MARPRVLFVDDDDAILAVFHKGFEEHFEVATASSGAEALGLLDDWEFPVIIVDQRMPGMTGAQLLKEVRCRQPEAVTMMVTGYASFENAVEAINQGHVVRYLKKPWNRAELLQALRDGVELFEKRRENRLLRDRLIAEERNVVIGQLASGLVHELANIAAVLAVVENLREDWGRGIDLTEEIQTLRSGVEKYWALVGSLKFCGSGQDKVQLTKVRRDVREMMQDAFDIAAHFPAVRLLKKFELEPGAATFAEVDGSALFHGLINLLKNAAEACPVGRGEVRFSAKEEEGWLKIEVRDNGPGIPEELARKIFAGFYSTKGAAGTGLGLLVTRRIVEGHGGKLEQHNLPAGGCMFSVVLRRSPA